jgi:hypothetical protein
MTKVNGAPLARDRHGNAILLPPGTARWRVRRQTGGRPRQVLGPNRQPLELPLDVTLDELEDMLGPGSYRLDAISEDGRPVDVSIAVKVPGGDEDDDEPPAPMAVSDVALPTGGSDVRLVLEANIRSMQMSFQHHERTLETSMRTVEALRDGVRALADAQAEWIKSLATSRSIPRNAFVQVPIAANANEPDAPEPDEDDDADDEERPMSPWEFAYGLVQELKPVIDVGAEVARAKFAKPRNSAASAAPAAKPASADTASPPESAPRAEPKARPSRPKASAAIPPALFQKMVAVREHLAPEEVQLLLHLLETMPDVVRDHWIETLEPLSVEDCVVAIRRELGMIGAERTDDGEAA